MFDKDDCGCEGRNENRCADKIIIAILAIIFVFVIGIIVGATTGLFDLIGTAAFVVIAVALGILIIARILIMAICDKRKNAKA